MLRSRAPSRPVPPLLLLFFFVVITRGRIIEITKIADARFPFDLARLARRALVSPTIISKPSARASSRKGFPSFFFFFLNLFARRFHIFEQNVSSVAAAKEILSVLLWINSRSKSPCIPSLAFTLRKQFYDTPENSSVFRPCGGISSRLFGKICC